MNRRTSDPRMAPRSSVITWIGTPSALPAKALHASPPIAGIVNIRRHNQRYAARILLSESSFEKPNSTISRAHLASQPLGARVCRTTRAGSPVRHSSVPLALQAASRPFAHVLKLLPQTVSMAAAKRISERSQRAHPIESDRTSYPNSSTPE